MNKLPLLILLLFSVMTFQTKAQNYIGLQFNYMQPLNEYGQNLESHPVGFGLSYLFKPKLFNKFYVGAQFGVSMYATDSYTESKTIENNQIIDIKIDEEDCFFSYSLTGRYYLVEEKFLNPYLEARIGGLSFFSTKMTDEEYDEYFDNSTTFHGTSFQLGLGGGLSVHVADYLWVDLNVIYNQGGHADYRNISSTDAAYRLNPSLGKFDSFTDNVNYSLGVQFGF